MLCCLHPPDIVALLQLLPFGLRNHYSRHSAEGRPTQGRTVMTFYQAEIFLPVRPGRDGFSNGFRLVFSHVSGASQVVAIIKRNAGLVLCTQSGLSMAKLPHLGGPGTGIGTAQLHKLCVSSGFHHPSLIQNVNDVGVHGRGESVGNHKRRPACG